MGNMYKETIGRRKLPSLVKFFSVLVISLFFMEIMEGFGKYTVAISSAFIILTLICEIMYCRVRYTYSIIADQFIIHRISGNEDKVVENIKLWDIEYVGQENLLVSHRKIFNARRYICSAFNVKPCYCIYRDGDKMKKFYFEPSDDLIKKIMFNKEKIA
ncbi:MAG: hypothetical protein AB2417_05815 [Clostridiaceae bacterium]